MNFADFLNRKFFEWQARDGRKTVEEFANLIGASQPIVSMWMNGSRLPGAKYRKQIIEVFGDEAAELLGEDPRLFFINQNWESASEDLQRSIHKQLQREVAKNEAQRSHSQRKKTSTK